METNEILDTSVAMDCGEGTITVFTLIEYPPAADKFFDIIFPETMDYVKALEIANGLRAKGTPLGAIDILIAAMCLNRSARLITKDNGFKFIQGVSPDFSLEVR